jgi:hypothetical protein
MDGRDHDEAKPYFGRARTVAGLLLIGLVAVLSTIDAFDDRFQLDSIQLGLILGTALLLLGVEAGKRLLR